MSISIAISAVEPHAYRPSTTCDRHRRSSIPTAQVEQLLPHVCNSNPDSGIAHARPVQIVSSCTLRCLVRSARVNSSWSAVCCCHSLLPCPVANRPRLEHNQHRRVVTPRNMQSRVSPLLNPRGDSFPLPQLSGRLRLRAIGKIPTRLSAERRARNQSTLQTARFQQ